MKNELINKSVIEDIYNKFGIRFITSMEIFGGWKHKKWKICDGENAYLVKLFSEERYSINYLKHVEKALVYQEALFNANVKTPLIYKSNNAIIQKTINNQHYMLMEFCKGQIKTQSEVTVEELFKVGKNCALIHKRNNSFGFEKNSIDNHETNLDNYIEDIIAKKYIEINDDFAKLIDKILVIYSNLDRSIFDRLKCGFTHSDFSLDNIIFGEKTIWILDFDRGRYSYQLQDVGRGIMSFAFDGEKVLKPLLDSFADGYNSVLPLLRDEIVDALTLIWIIEVTWWLKRDLYLNKNIEKIDRFKKEIEWLTDQLYLKKLNEIII